MKREYVGIIFLLITVIILIGGSYIIEQTKIDGIVNKFIIIWLLIAYQIGQYSMKFPKKF
ncbi:hypothetical protein FLGE108171_13710 [Flavobacterium gelidilacus]|jgi:TM2 domain-containing membrane protein YozV|uniref:hypothetical protein n=1 Tax=Flavobacterium gelidilacus TaxID=206041 RepID=UPI00040FBCF8|nr:hypothetical protein [Flavobacterium gelidilacus]